MRTPTWFAAGAFTLTLGVAPAVSAQPQPDIDELWQIVQAQQRTIEALSRKLDQAIATIAGAEQKLTAAASQLEQNTEAIEATADAVEREGFGGGSVAASWAERTAIGGYGELHYNNLDDDAVIADGDADDRDRVDFHRFVLYFNHEFTDSVRLGSELELEHSLSSEDGPGEVELEQAWLELDINAHHRIRVGLDILPIGIINVTHEPNTFYGVERNRVETEIIPATWWEAGLGFIGEIMPGLNYDLIVHSGLDIPTPAESGASAFRPRSGRTKVAEADATDVAFTGRVRYTGYPGLELALSGQYQADYTGTDDGFDASAYLLETHIDYRHSSGLALRALYARWELGSDAAAGLLPRARNADILDGWYVEPAYRMAVAALIPGELGIFGRYAEWDERDNLGVSFQQFDEFVAGVNYWPTPKVVFKFDAQWQDAAGPVAVVWDSFNLGMGYQF